MFPERNPRRRAVPDIYGCKTRKAWVPGRTHWANNVAQHEIGHGGPRPRGNVALEGGKDMKWKKGRAGGARRKWGEQTQGSGMGMLEGKKFCTLLDLCVSSLRRGHANLLCIVPILADVPRKESKATRRP